MRVIGLYDVIIVIENKQNALIIEHSSQNKNMNLVKCKAFSATYFFAKYPSVIKIKPM